MLVFFINSMIILTDNKDNNVIELYHKEKHCLLLSSITEQMHKQHKSSTPSK